MGNMFTIRVFVVQYSASICEIVIREILKYKGKINPKSSSYSTVRYGTVHCTLLYIVRYGTVRYGTVYVDRIT